MLTQTNIKGSLNIEISLIYEKEQFKTKGKNIDEIGFKNIQNYQSL